MKLKELIERLSEFPDEMETEVKITSDEESGYYDVNDIYFGIGSKKIIIEFRKDDD